MPECVQPLPRNANGYCRRRGDPTRHQWPATPCGLVRNLVDTSLGGATRPVPFPGPRGGGSDRVRAVCRRTLADTSVHQPIVFPGRSRKPRSSVRPEGEVAARSVRARRPSRDHPPPVRDEAIERKLLYGTRSSCFESDSYTGAVETASVFLDKFRASRGTILRMVCEPALSYPSLTQHTINAVTAWMSRGIRPAPCGKERHGNDEIARRHVEYVDR